MALLSSLCGLERSILRRVYRIGGCRVRGVLRPFGPTGQPDPTIIQTAPRPDYFFLWLYAVLSFLPPSMETPALLIGPVIVIGALLLLHFCPARERKVGVGARLLFSRSCLSPLHWQPSLISQDIPVEPAHERMEQ